MWYAVDLYPGKVVCGFGHRFNISRPSDIPFRDLTHIPGRTRVSSGPSPAGIADASDSSKQTERMLVSTCCGHPECGSPCLDTRHPACTGRARAASLSHDGLGVAFPTRCAAKFADHRRRPPSRHDELSLHVLGPSGQRTGDGAASDTSSALPPERAQRSDVNKSRKRPVTIPESSEALHSKHGPLTARCVVETEGIAPGRSSRARRPYLPMKFWRAVPRLAGSLAARAVTIRSSQEDVECANGW